MKYDLVEMIRIKMALQGLECMPTPAIGILRDINNSAFKELDGLKPNRDYKCLERDIDNYKETIIPLTNKDNEDVKIIIHTYNDLVSLRIENNSKEFRLLYNYYKRKGNIELSNMNYTYGKDNIVLRRLVGGPYFAAIYTNTVGTEEVYDNYSMNVMPDYCCMLNKIDNENGVIFKTNEEYSYGYESPRIGNKEFKLDSLTKSNTLARSFRFVAERIDEEFHNNYLFDKPKQMTLLNK